MDEIWKPYHKIRIRLPVISSVILTDRNGVPCSSLPHLQHHRRSTVTLQLHRNSFYVLYKLLGTLDYFSIKVQELSSALRLSSQAGLKNHHPEFSYWHCKKVRSNRSCDFKETKEAFPWPNQHVHFLHLLVSHFKALHWKTSAQAGLLVNVHSWGMLQF